MADLLATALVGVGVATTAITAAMAVAAWRDIALERPSRQAAERLRDAEAAERLAAQLAATHAECARYWAAAHPAGHIYVSAAQDCTPGRHTREEGA